VTSGEKKRSGWRKLLPENVWAVVIGPIVVGLTIAGVIALVNSLTSKEPEPELQGLDPVVHNGIAKFRYSNPATPTLGTSHQTDESKARIEIRLKNNGDQRTYLTSAIFTVRKQIVITPCGLGAGVPISGSYEVVLPRRSAPGEKVEVPIDQQIGPDEADRFVFRVGPELSERDLGLTLVYQLDIAVRHDGSDEPAGVGQAVIALPGSPRDFILPSDIVGRPPTGCAQDTLNKLREAAQLDGVRSPEFQSVLASAEA
jgi:hypothetical protein